MNAFVDYLSDGSHWSGEDGVPHRLLEHLGYSFGALVLVILIGLPLGLWVGHTGRGAVAVAGSANALRALPTFGLLVFVVIAISGSLPARFTYLGPSLLVLVVLGIPSVLSNTYAGVQSVDPAARDAAKGMGMTGMQVLWRVEVPNALPLIISGIRNATLQIVATATIRKVGHTARPTALAPMIATDSPATSRFEPTQSTKAPPGTCPSRLNSPPMVSTRPISA